MRARHGKAAGAALALIVFAAAPFLGGAGLQGSRVAIDRGSGIPGIFSAFHRNADGYVTVVDTSLTPDERVSVTPVMVADFTKQGTTVGLGGSEVLLRMGHGIDGDTNVTTAPPEAWPIHCNAILRNLRVSRMKDSPGSTITRVFADSTGDGDWYERVRHVVFCDSFPGADTGGQSEFPTEEIKVYEGEYFNVGVLSGSGWEDPIVLWDVFARDSIP